MAWKWWFDTDVIRVLLTSGALFAWLKWAAQKKTDREEFEEHVMKLDAWGGCSAGCENCSITCDRDTRRIWE